ncbi:MAG: peptidoglycan-binding protein [Candidatus Omnitrophica bacterium]|nr:peptidoglycan-binding protein [Candidatus Omnitrophota bacterium]MBU1996637.1 peptidoglycan-binding protein [Candidatus Omnitrophota bacterium]MBU4333151.1 peptidoglycan-binding protein [Candidatus Omnitrophota bacterium]
MNIKKFVLGLIILIFLGCSATNDPSTVSNLQVKVAQIENRMNKKEQELEKLKYEVREIAKLVEGFDSMQDDDIEDDFDDIKIEEPIIKRPIAKTKTKPTENGTIRVSVKVITVQQALTKAGYYNGSIDGKLGSKTKSAIVEFQKDHGLVSDGIIGKKTWDEMSVYLAK